MTTARGENLSGGQRQRVAIARALLKDAPLIIMDEPTSAMDHITETKILDTISQLKKLGKGVLIITHKESTAGIADCIYEMVSANNEIPALPT
jgi:ABC-type multidrug transport system fused ATPase/permease subunit